MRAPYPYPIGIALLAFCQSVTAEVVHPPYPAPASGSGSLMQIMFSLLLVIATIIAVAWLLKRMNVTRQGSGNQLKVISGVAIGQRERIVLVEIEDTWLVVGIGPGQVRTLHTLQKPDVANEAVSNTPQTMPFNAWLQKFIEKRDAT